MAGEPYTAVTDGPGVGPPNIGLSPERIQELSQQARVRIAAENAVKEAQKAEKAERQAAAKRAKLEARQKIHDKSDKGKNAMDGGCNILSWTLLFVEISNVCSELIKEQKQEMKSVFGSLKNLLKKNKEDTYVR